MKDKLNIMLRDGTTGLELMDEFVTKKKEGERDVFHLKTKMKHPLTHVEYTVDVVVTSEPKSDD